jgi:DNA-binding winged helix-turn-helix (wHTH) protein
VLIAIIGGQSQDEEHLARIAASSGQELEFCLRDAPFRVGNDAEDDDTGVRPRALVFEALDRADLAVGALRAVRKDPYFDRVGALLALQGAPANYGDLPGGFDDFVFHPFTPEELQVRLRALEQRRPATGSSRANPVEGIVVEEASRTLYVEGAVVQLTAREFALFSHFCEWRGEVLSREHLLSRVWGSRYSGGRRTVDIHVRRLRAKLGDHLPLETVRGRGYRLRLAGDEAAATDQPISAAVSGPTLSSSS